MATNADPRASASASSIPKPAADHGAAKATPDKRKRVLIIGAGASGMSAAYALSLSPEKFVATVYDKAPGTGGSATSYTLPNPQRYGADYINDGVQGASPVFHNTFGMFEDVLGFKATEVQMQISFGKGDHKFWSNVFPSHLVDQFQDDIKKFGRVLKTIKRFEPFFAVIPVSRMLRMFNFSESFGERMVYPLVALFFGTGNETKNISSAILERVFLDPSMRLFEFSEKSLLASVPIMMAFPELARVYGEWRRLAKQTGNVRVETNREVTEVNRNTKAARAQNGHIHIRSRRVDDEGKPLPGEAERDEKEEVFDDVIMATDADAALKMLQAGSGATWKERRVLGNVLYKWDTTITHSDYDYMERLYQMTYDDSLNAKRTDAESSEAFKFAREHWRPLYLINMYDHDPACIEMSFDLTHYQPQFAGKPAVGAGARIKMDDAVPTERQGYVPPGYASNKDKEGGAEAADASSASSSSKDGAVAEKQTSSGGGGGGGGANGTAPSSDGAGGVDPLKHPDTRPIPPAQPSSYQTEPHEAPVKDHVYQSIFLDRDQRQHWTDSQIRKDEVILQKWWKQQSHRWQLYAFTVPWMWTINGGRNHTSFAGGWTLVNMHEVAICSGFGAAYALGAKYPLGHNKEARRLVSLLYLLQHAGRMRKEDRDGFL